MRLVKPDAEPRKYITADGAFKTYAYVTHDIIEISDTEWNLILYRYICDENPSWYGNATLRVGMPFADYLHELLILAGEANERD
jgi:hypothetical protein